MEAEVTKSPRQIRDEIEREVELKIANTLPAKVAEISLSYSSKIKKKDRYKITGVCSAASVVRSTWTNIELFEQFKVILLDRANHVLGVVKISQGGIDATTVDLKLIFAAAIKAKASGIILAHNHPSGNRKPSDSDKSITQKIKAAGNLLGITVMDHLIITYDDHFSFAEVGYL